MKCKKHPTVLWEFFTAKSEHRSQKEQYFYESNHLPQHSTHGSLHITMMQSGRQSLTGSRSSSKPTVKEQPFYESNH